MNRNTRARCTAAGLAAIAALTLTAASSTATTNTATGASPDSLRMCPLSTSAGGWTNTCPHLPLLPITGLTA